MNAAPEPDLTAARRALVVDPATALALATRVSRARPDSVEARFIMGAAMRRTGDLGGARQVLVPLAAAQPKSWGLQFEAGATLAILGETKAAVAALTRAVTLNPMSSLAWHALGDQIAIMGDTVGAERAHARPVPGAIGDPALMDAARIFFDGQADRARTILSDRFHLRLSDLIAVRMLADAGLRLGRHEAVGDFLAPYLDAAPWFSPLHESQAVVLYRLQDFAPALEIVDRLLVAAPRWVSLNTLRAALLVEVGRYEAALEVYADLLERRPDQPRLWISRGHILKTLGRQTESVAAYRRSLALNPGLGEAYWSLANLKVVRFDDDDLTQMRRLLGQEDLSLEDRVPLHFALAKALEDDLQFEESFAHYQRGAALGRTSAPYDADAHHARIGRLIQTFTPTFLASRAGSGAAAPDPIFIVGLPRSGSTLIEQMLASHSSVEATAELSDLTVLARALARRLATSGGTYPAALAELDVSVFAELGEAYLARTRLYRRSDRPYFIDKFPTNFIHLGLIHLILPHAKIIDARRHPMACGLSVFKQNFAQGQAYSRNLNDLGRYYADYVRLMAHFDEVLPGRVHRVVHESLVENPETELRRLLDYCGLPFEAACLRFHESARPVRTASSEQVRRPISREGIDHWRHFEPWLGPLRAALGPALAD